MGRRWMFCNLWNETFVLREFLLSDIRPCISVDLNYFLKFTCVVWFFMWRMKILRMLGCISMKMILWPFWISCRWLKFSSMCCWWLPTQMVICDLGIFFILSLIFVYFDNVKSILIVWQVPRGMTVIKPQSLCSWNCWLSVHVLWIYSGVGSRPIIFPDINSSTRELAEWSGTQLNPLEVPTEDWWTLCTYQKTIDYRVCV